MASSIHDVTQQIIEHRNWQIQKVLHSIETLGLAPSSAISTEILVTFIIGSEETRQSISVNYLDLNNCSDTQITNAIKIAVWEEYTGIFGISLERVWPLTNTTNNSVATKEIIDRLHSNILFVLSAPVKTSAYKLPIISELGQPLIGANGKQITKSNGEPLIGFWPTKSTKCYELQRGTTISEDAFYQSRDKCLDLTTGEAPEVIEIKTTHHFKDEEILAVLVPQELLALIPLTFRDKFGKKIIPVPDTAQLKPINKLPYILTRLHKEAIGPGFTCFVPNYEETLARYIVPIYKEFSLHAVRLPTIFDFMPRFSTDLPNNSDLLKSCQGIKLIEYHDSSGWFLVHRSKLINIQQIGVSMSPYLDPTVIRTKILAAKGEFLMSIYPNNMDETAQKGLCSLDEVTAIKLDYGIGGHLATEPVMLIMLSYPQKHKIAITNLSILKEIGLQAIRNEKLEQARIEAATATQTAIRACLSRRSFFSYQHAMKEHKEAEQMLTNAQQHFAQTQAGLELAKQKLINKPT